FLILLISAPVFAYEDMEKNQFCQELSKLYPPDKIRDDMIDDINLRQSTQESEYITRTIWHTDAGYHTVALNRATPPLGSMHSGIAPEIKLQDPGHLHAAISEVVSCIAGFTTLANLPQYYLSRGFASTAVELNLIQKDVFGTREEYLEYLWSIRNGNWDRGARYRTLVVRLMQAGLEDKKFFDYVAPGVRSSYPHYIPMLEFFQRSTGLNYETLRQALKHEDYFVFEWAVKKISSQHITELYTELADAINQLIGMPVRKTSSRELGRTHKLYLFHEYKYLPFEDEILEYEYKAHYLYPPPAWFYHSLPPNPKIKEEYQIRKSEKLY
ncbi:MAG: hypothetical protein H3C47_14415, partial [Candidatus Cloacimonetes bacterium]|nr:hypothetical protein [Candidatus Cloacimonadota bacterium]